MMSHLSEKISSVFLLCFFLLLLFLLDDMSGKSMIVYISETAYLHDSWTLNKREKVIKIYTVR